MSAKFDRYMISSQEIRRKFLLFFSEKEHHIFPSAPMVIKDDPTLMFTNAGMNQFKDLILGNAEIQHARVADTQKCLRVSGKHNDLEEVGHDTYHHTMFEMLGNWSFGDYFKKEAIAWAWELLTDVYGLDKDRLFVTVFEGDEGDDLGMDREAFREWSNIVPEDRILMGNKKDNFWEMGDQGPCGPSSEIHIDLRSDEERRAQSGTELVNQDHPLVVEIWNLVFMEYNRLADGSLVHLPKKHVDTGMGFERLCMALQGVKSNYDTDVFKPIIDKIGALTDHTYGENEKADIAMRVVADHVRAIAFSIVDGQLPGNNGAGYVIRRILRRASRYGFTFLDQKEPFIYKLIEVLDELMGYFFEGLRQQKDLIEKVIQEEEASFLRTLEQGLKHLDQYLSESKSNELAGDKVFELYDTYGFPTDLTELILRECGMEMNRAEYEQELNRQKERSRAAAEMTTDDWVVLTHDEKEEFVGYDYLKTDVRVTRYRKVKTKKAELFQIAFNLTPFYPEGGGQVGDRGYIQCDDDKIEILDTKKENNLIVHMTTELPCYTDRTYKAVVDSSVRRRTENNHSATHLLHKALREVLGDHVEQRGSLVHPDHLRFDFSHFQKMSDEEIKRVEDWVNLRVRQNIQLEEHRSVPMSTAKDMGTMMLFGEKYGDTVRVIQFGESLELCGGTHVPSTGQIGHFKIVSESAIAAGIRRIEAITADKADAYFREQEGLLQQVKVLLKSQDPLKSIAQLRDENHKMQRQIESLLAEKAGGLKDELLKDAIAIDGGRLIVAKVDLDPGSIKNLAFELKAENDDLVVVIATVHNGKPNLNLLVCEPLAKSKDWNAGKIIRDLAQEIKGGGGGQPFFASAGGKEAGGIDRALEKAKELFQG